MQIIKRNCESDTTRTIELFAGTGGIAKMISEIVSNGVQGVQTRLKRKDRFESK